jgi:fucose permease
MNAHGVDVEEHLRRPIMSGLHGMWSLGALAGAGVGALAAELDVDARVHHGVVAVLLVGAAFAAGRRLMHTEPDHDIEAPPAFALPTRDVLLIGAVAFCAVFAEGASHDWCAVYLDKVTGAGKGTAGAGYAVFALMMAGGRLGGDAVVARLGPVRTVGLGGVVATVGGALVVASRSPIPAIVGFALIGAGIATVVPLSFAAAARSDVHPGRAIAGVASIAYASGLAAPAAIGVIARLTSLPRSFSLVTVLLLLVALGARAMTPASVASPAALTR